MSSRSASVAASLLMVLSGCSAAAEPTGDDASPVRSAPASGNAPGAKTGAAAPGGSFLDLGTVAAGAPVTFDVPAGTIGFTIIVDATVGPDDAIGVQELAAPGDAAVIHEFLDATSPGRYTTGWTGSGMGIVQLPLVGDRASTPVPSGRWTARFGGASGSSKSEKGSTTPWSGNVHASVRFQTSTDGAFHGGALDVDFYVPENLSVEGHTVTAASAATDADIRTRVDGMFGLVQRLYGIGRGEVRYHALPASVLEISGQSAVDAANALATATNAHPAAQVILTNRLSPDGDDSEISGVSNCLPGAVGVPGTACSAVIVSLRASSPAWEDATTIVHELGHFVGLEHTTEFGGSTDSLADTPACTSTEKSALASCPDHDNLMFPSVNLADAEEAIAVSATQQAIVRSSPLYRATR